ncbi:MAG: ABC transporter ATP-binding protein [Agathobacter sp.]|nr:ABC transporter ATP-binding protein [Agathobacter sp.]
MIRLENLSKYYYGNNTVALGLRKINLEFHKGEFVAITGESGSGKTTLLSTISGLLPYEEGEMYFDGNATSYYDETDWEEYRKNHIAFVFQNYNLIDSYTALENVMTSFLIQGESVSYAKEKSMELLEVVGIAQYASHRATELSSGQKQRLAIARALAKNTEVIVADELTGNLDAENGRQIIELFSELAKDKLVLIVTHNYEEAAPYVTRKIMIHDGEVEEDIQIRENRIISDLSENRNAKEQNIKHNAWFFSKTNIKSRLGRSVILCGLMLVVSIACCFFLGNFVANLDDTETKVYENSAFYNSDDTRIVVRYPDGSPMTEDDMEVLKTLEHVVYTDKYSLANDLYYFSEKGVDYQVTYSNIQTEKEGDPIYQENIYLDKYSKFVFSTSGLEQEDLLCGRFPENTNEVVIYAEDESMLNSQFPCFFSDQRHWPINAYIRMEMTVCGILKEPTEQYYFSENLCKVLSNNVLNYRGMYAFGVLYNNAIASSGYQTIMFYVDDTYDLKQEEVMTAGDIYQSSKDFLMMGLRVMVSDDYQLVSGVDINHMESEEPIVVGRHNSSKQFMAISQEMYDTLYEDIATTQMGVYVEDYAYVADVLGELREKGYEAVAPYQIGSVKYDDAKVTERLVTLALSLCALVVLLTLEVIIIVAFMRTEKRSALILKSMGMSQSMLSKINQNTLWMYHGIAFLLMLVLVFGFGNWIPQIKAILIYYRFYHVILLFLLCSLAIGVTIGIVNRYLARFVKAGSEVRV